MQALGAAGYAFTSVASREQSKRGRLIYGRQCVSARGVWIASSGIEPSGAWAMSAAKVNGCDIGIFAASWCGAKVFGAALIRRADHGRERLRC